MFDALAERFEGIFTRLRGRGRLSERDVEEATREIRLALLEADVNVRVVRDLVRRVRERATGAEVHQSLTPAQQVIKIVHEELVATLGGANVGLHKSGSPQTILVVGLQGSGKTTTAAKLAAYLLHKGRRPLLVAADLARPAAVDQLETLGRRLGVPVFADRKSKPTRVVKAALREARRAGQDAVIVDTAGRLQVDAALMAELKDLADAAHPDEVLLVVDAMTGQDAVNVAQGFAATIAPTGIVLSKLDGDARGGAAISVREVTGAPVKFAGVGEGLDALEPFHPDRMASRILGMGDVLTLIEKAEASFDRSQAEKTVRKLERGEFSLEDFLEQFQQVKKMGPLADLLAMLPGGAAGFRHLDIDDRQVRRVEAIIRSMTPAERRHPGIMNGSRKRRVAAGSGTTPQEVNNLLKQFADAQRMMRSLTDLSSLGGRRRRGGGPALG